MTKPDVFNFDCGSDEWAVEVAEPLRNGQALAEHNPKKGRFTLLYVILDEFENVVGYAQVVFGKPVGYPEFKGPAISCIHIVNTAISSQHQHKGYFRSMMGDLAATAIAKKLVAIDLFVHKDNLPAITAYTNLGFIWHPTAPMYPADNPKYRRMLFPLQPREVDNSH